MTRPVLVLPSPPTANGDLHLGHLAGPYLAADAFARYRRMRGHDVAYVTGADVHQSYVVRAAERMHMTPEDTADQFAQRIEDTLRAADVEVNAFVRPHRSASYQSFVKDFFQRLSDQSCLTDEERPALWCESCSQYLLGAAVRGKCGHCGADCDGALCEQCSHPVNAQQLLDPACARCNAPSALRPLRRVFFAPGALASELRSYHAQVRMRAHPRAVIEELLKDGLFEAAITSPGTWGVPVPLPGFEDQRLDVWAEVGPGYLASTQEMTARSGDPDGWRRYWCRDDAEVVQFFGFDNTAPHTLLYPALYLAHGELRPPDSFVINEFHRLDGEKFSTSRQHAVWGSDILPSVSVDALRYYLCLTAPEGEQGDFTLSDFRRTVNDDLNGVVDALLQETVGALASGDVPPSLGHMALAVMQEARDGAEELGRFLEPETFSLQHAARRWRDMTVSLGVRLRRAGSEPVDRVRDTDRAKRVLGDALSVVAGCAQPLMPGFARRLWETLGAHGDLRTHRWGTPARRLRSGISIPADGSWFPPVTEAQLKALTSESVGA